MKRILKHSRLGLLLWLGLLATPGLAQTAEPDGPPLDDDAVAAQVTEKIEKFGVCLVNITNAQRLSEAERKKEIRTALDLFESDTVAVQVASGKVPQTFTIKQYLRNLLNLADKKNVRITSFKVTKVSKLELGPDGSYYGVAEYFQSFTESAKDINFARPVGVRKNIKVKLARKSGGGLTADYFEIFLSDITLKEMPK
jgi:hypothetical protein